MSKHFISKEYSEALVYSIFFTLLFVVYTFLWATFAISFEMVGLAILYFVLSIAILIPIVLNWIILVQEYAKHG